MADLTALTTPFGLLDAETQAALKAHGGPYEWYSEGGWIDWAPRWAQSSVYRVKPQPPTKPGIDWSHVAKEYKWLARDKYGEAFVFISTPEIYLTQWVYGGGEPEAIRVDCLLSSYTPGTCDWRESLAQRPEDV